MVDYVRKDIPAKDLGNALSQCIDWYRDLAHHMGIVTSVWSIFTVRDFHEVPYQCTTLIYKDHWGPLPVRITFERPPTWADLWEGCEKAIRQSGDHHHIYIERISLRNDGKVMYLTTGS